ncbi:leucine-rich repeats and immunoglobulin-like domains protein 3 [Macrosteles quadrilineatus]|uniref:leucine-rich repeats and immunoglobulin-like domains protein 3 n=1 Tax=Macrosteles quadrilineatus TaxID=74068 RepID=UPI0023E0D3D8|nr:leucine-rich repeats and immunoglobulin-like domains protein 3 [Macrosteles quadrilineatus]XP_054272077.1 leucine-rich repeats and immunoglobulin-like domains protein 3 [Macrosteles quadrilineatus]XP_054290178.1 leucine-rich repeats and immunoglobulin-like domains protein 3 [Macrosteles quadrilineatus]XP_054290179.1 leucine-rich repeats and immunoglobulin-like domains protein 3 [Macrosteles quadrilineatus]
MVGYLWAVVAVGVYIAVTNAQNSQICPPRSELEPCACTPKKNGLDILCEFTDLQHISKAMAVLKGKPSIVIFYLKLRHNNLPKLQSFVFLGVDIRHLTIHNSSLSVIEESSLSSMGKGLTQLDLSQNKLNLVPSPAFRNLHHLLILNMNHNRVNALHSKAFEGLDTLEILTLYENKITNIESDAFKGLDKKLKRLNLGGNKLTSVPQEAFSILDTLKKLELQENSITSITEGDFEGLHNLDSLGLAHNHLREVPARVFSHLTQLNSLELDGNQITHIDVDAFVGLEENLQYLRLGDNNLHEIPSDALRRLHRLRHLDLRANNITVIAEDAFSGYGDSITFLNLQKNDIKILPAMAFDNLNSLETLNLQNNKLTHIPEEIMEPIVDTLRVVDIMDNPLICDCQLRWFRDWIKNLKDKDDEMMQKKRTLCTMMPEHQEYYVQNLPLDKMNCVSKGLIRGRASAAVATCMLPYVLTTVVTCSVRPWTLL